MRDSALSSLEILLGGKHRRVDLVRFEEHANIFTHESKINEHVYRLYEITKDEIKIIEEVV